MCLLLGGAISLLLYMLMFNFYALFLIGCHYQKGGECWGMVSSLLVLMNDKPCVLTCSMKVKRSILLIRAMDHMHYEEIEPTWWILELDEHEGCFEDFLYLLSLRIYCEEPSITLHPLTLMHTCFKSKTHQHEFSSSSSFEQLSCFTL